MTYSVYQHWDPLKVCIVGRSYSPEFYSFIKNDRVRTVMERIAKETEEDYQKLIQLLESFGVKILRPNVSDNYKDYIYHGKILPPPMTPRDYSIMFGDKFYFKADHPLRYIAKKWDHWRGGSWPLTAPTTYDEFKELPTFIKDELESFLNKDGYYYNIESLSHSKDYDISAYSKIDQFTWKPIFDHLSETNNQLINIVPFILDSKNFNAAETTRIGKDMYVGTRFKGEDISEHIKNLKSLYSDYRWHVIKTFGHSDGTFCPVKPGLIVSLYDIPTYTNTFPGWEVIYLPNQSWSKVQPFMELKNKNSGKWWVPGEELNDDFTEFVESWLGHWVGYVEETVFDVNMLVIDEKNVVCNNYNKDVFDAFERHDITPHIINFRHRYFWDGGLHCITSDVHREGTMKDYFPERG